MKEYLSANGINNETNLPMIEEREVNICMKYLKNIEERKEFSDTSSYGLKQIIENKENTYISNGAFIKAVIKSGLKYKRISDDSFNIKVKFGNKELYNAFI